MQLWTVHGDGRNVAPGDVVAPEERLAWPQTVGVGMQHVLAMFGATFLVPVLTGFPVATTLLFSGVGTLLFLALTRGRVPSYLGSSFAFIAPISAVSFTGGPPDPALLPLALGGLVVSGLVLTGVGLLVQAFGTRWVDLVLPPVVTGAVVALIGLNLVGVAKMNYSPQPGIATVTLVAILLLTVVAARVPRPALDRARGGRRLAARDGARRPRRRPPSRASTTPAARAARPHRAPLLARGGGAVRAGRRRPGRRERGARQGGGGHDRARPGPRARADAARGRARHDARRGGRRLRDHDLRREHRRHGGHPGLLLRGVRRRRRHRGAARRSRRSSAPWWRRSRPASSAASPPRCTG